MSWIVASAREVDDIGTTNELRFSELDAELWAQSLLQGGYEVLLVESPEEANCYIGHNHGRNMVYVNNYQDVAVTFFLDGGLLYVIRRRR